MASLVLAIHGFVLLRKVGMPAGGIEQTTRLVTEGAYRYIRHPLYASLILFAAGTFLKRISLLGFVILAAAVGCLYATARTEERENRAKFGQQYLQYMRHTRMFIPHLL